MRRLGFLLFALLVPGSLLPGQGKGALSGVDRAIERGVDALLRLQLADGSWRGPQPDHYHGMTALAVYTLLKCGLPSSHPAIQAGLASFRTHRIERTYDLGCALMMYQAMGDDRPMDEIKVLADRIVKQIGNGKRTTGPRWGYPGNHGGEGYEWVDLSNSQYALLGLRAAKHAGYKAGTTQFWEWIAKDLIDLQESYGGFGYRQGEKASSSMTVAGVTMIVVCQEMLGDDADLGLRGRMKASVQRGLEWLDQHWAVDRMVDLRQKGGTTNRWVYYFLYGLERLGAFADLEKIGDHQWYPEGATEILKRQKGDGRWMAEGNTLGDEDTCFALLFLRRGSRSSGLPPRSRAEQAELAAAPFAIGMDGDNPVNVWVRATGEPLKKLLAEGAKPKTLTWLVGSEVAASVGPLADEQQLFGEAANLRHSATRNGEHVIAARLELVWADGRPAAILDSNELKLRVDNVAEPWQREAVRDSRKNLLLGRIGGASASSELDAGRAAAKAADGHFGTSWISARDDKEPWIQIQLAPAVPASLLKLTSAGSYGGSSTHYARPRDLEIRINDDGPVTVRLEDAVHRKQWVRFASKQVRQLRIRVKSSYPGDPETYAVGFQEIELFGDDGGTPEDALSLRPGVEVVLPPARFEGVTWRFTTERPADDWMQEGFKDLRWKEAKSGFGNLKSSYAPERTPWETTDLWIRREFALPLTGELGELRIEICHDDHCEVFVNGVPAAFADKWSRAGYRTLALSEEARKSLRPGRNLIAAHCVNTGGVGYLDISLIRILPVRAKGAGR